MGLEADIRSMDLPSKGGVMIVLSFIAHFKSSELFGVSAKDRGLGLFAQIPLPHLKDSKLQTKGSRMMRDQVAKNENSVCCHPVRHVRGREGNDCIHFPSLSFTL